MTKKLLKHTDVDSTLWPGVDQNPVGLMFKLGCLASLLVVIISWALLVIGMAGRVIEWAAWPFVALPLAAWLLLLALPAFLSARRGALAILDAIAMTAEAWLARAGYSVDLNNDGLVGYEPPTIEPVKTNVVAPVLWNNVTGTRLLASDAPTLDGPEPADPVQRTLWKLPNGTRCPVETVCRFVDGIFIRGWNRETWVPARLDRDSYDGLILLLEQGNILEGRKSGFAGRLTLSSAVEARRVLGLPVHEPG